MDTTRSSPSWNGSISEVRSPQSSTQSLFVNDPLLGNSRMNSLRTQGPFCDSPLKASNFATNFPSTVRLLLIMFLLKITSVGRKNRC